MPNKPNVDLSVKLYQFVLNKLTSIYGYNCYKFPEKITGNNPKLHVDLVSINA